MHGLLNRAILCCCCCACVPRFAPHNHNSTSAHRVAHARGSSNKANNNGLLRVVQQRQEHEQEAAIGGGELLTAIKYESYKAIEDRVVAPEGDPAGGKAAVEVVVAEAVAATTDAVQQPAACDSNNSSADTSVEAIPASAPNSSQRASVAVAPLPCAAPADPAVTPRSPRAATAHEQQQRLLPVERARPSRITPTTSTAHSSRDDHGAEKRSKHHHSDGTNATEPALLHSVPDTGSRSSDSFNALLHRSVDLSPGASTDSVATLRPSDAGSGGVMEKVSRNQHMRSGSGSGSGSINNINPPALVPTLEVSSSSTHTFRSDVSWESARSSSASSRDSQSEPGTPNSALAAFETDKRKSAGFLELEPMVSARIPVVPVKNGSGGEEAANKTGSGPLAADVNSK
jgi:hypothetical protein